MRQYPHPARSSSDIDDFGVGIIPWMCNRVTNPCDMSIFSRPACGVAKAIYEQLYFSHLGPGACAAGFNNNNLVNI